MRYIIIGMKFQTCSQTNLKKKIFHKKQLKNFRKHKINSLQDYKKYKKI